MRPTNQDTELFNRETPTISGQGVENAEDELNILADQDETLLANPMDVSDDLGADGTPDNFGLDEEGAFARGEVDLKEQMDRTTARMDADHHRPRDPDITPHSKQGKVDTTPDMHVKPEEAAFKPAHKGHETGAYTDIGAGKSGVTRSH